MAAAAKHCVHPRGVAARLMDSVAPFSAFAEERMIATTNILSTCTDRDMLNDSALHC